MNFSAFSQAIIIFGYLFSGLYTTVYVASGKWYDNIKDFEVCEELPASIILIQIVNLCIVLYLIIYNIWNCVCNTLLQNKAKIGFTCCSFLFLVIIIASYVFGLYVLIAKKCYSDYHKTYPHLWNCLQVALVTKLIIIIILFIASIYTCYKRKLDNLKSKILSILENKDYLNLGRLKELLLLDNPSFDVRNHGFKKMNELINNFNDILQVTRSDDRLTLFVSRRN